MSFQLTEGAANEYFGISRQKNRQKIVIQNSLVHNIFELIIFKHKDPPPPLKLESLRAAPTLVVLDSLFFVRRFTSPGTIQFMSDCRTFLQIVIFD